MTALPTVSISLSVPKGFSDRGADRRGEAKGFGETLDGIGAKPARSGIASQRADGEPRLAGAQEAEGRPASAAARSLATADAELAAKWARLIDRAPEHSRARTEPAEEGPQLPTGHPSPPADEVPAGHAIGTEIPEEADEGSVRTDPSAPATHEPPAAPMPDAAAPANIGPAAVRTAGGPGSEAPSDKGASTSAPPPAAEHAARPAAAASDKLAQAVVRTATEPAARHAGAGMERAFPRVAPGDQPRPSPGPAAAALRLEAAKPATAFQEIVSARFSGDTPAPQPPRAEPPRIAAPAADAEPVRLETPLSGDRPVLAGTQSLPAPAVPAQATSAALVGGIAADLEWNAFLRNAAAIEQQRAQAGPAPVRALQLQLHPAELGMVTARLQFVAEQLTIDIQVDNAEAFRRLGAESETIARAIRALGFEVDRVTIQQSSGAPAGSEREASNGGGQREAASSSSDPRGEGGRSGNSSPREREERDAHAAGRPNDNDGGGAGARYI